MKKEKIHLEYLLNTTSKNILWSATSTSTGLEGWFADKVVSDGKTMAFCWGETGQRRATIVAIRACSFIRFHRPGGRNEREYFEIRVNNNELTDDYVLEISDFSDPGEVDDLKELWDSQMSKLRRACDF